MARGSITATSGLHVIGIDHRGTPRSEATMPRLFPPVIVDPLDVEGVEVAGDDSKDSEADVDEEI